MPFGRITRQRVSILSRNAFGSAVSGSLNAQWQPDNVDAERIRNQNAPPSLSAFLMSVASLSWQMVVFEQTRERRGEQRGVVPHRSACVRPFESRTP
jgi:hypothetical protein